MFKFNGMRAFAAAGLLSLSLSLAAHAAPAVTYDTPQDLVEASRKVTTEFKEGVHYKVIENARLSEVKEVREFFSFFCGHCHAFLPVINQISLALPEDVSFQRSHVKYLGGPMGPEMQKAYATAVDLRVAEIFVEKVDDNVFNKHKIPKNHDEVAAIFEEIGVPRDTFENQFKSFPVTSAVSQYNQLADDSKIEGVPTVTVNNKYRILTGEIKGTDEYFALVTYLLNLDNDHYAK